MVKILVVDDEADLEVLIKQKFRKKIRERANTNLYLPSTASMHWSNWNITGM